MARRLLSVFKTQPFGSWLYFRLQLTEVRGGTPGLPDGASLKSGPGLPTVDVPLSSSRSHEYGSRINFRVVTV